MTNIDCSKETQPSRNMAIDAMKGIASVFVVLIHCMFPGLFGAYMRALARFAVPFFFAVSGYFYVFTGERGTDSRLILRKIRHLLELALISGAFYLVVFYCEDYFKHSGTYTIAAYLSDRFAWERIVRFFLVNTPLVYSPRWFLYALIYSYLFILFLYRCGVKDCALFGTSTILLIVYYAIVYYNAVSGRRIEFPIGSTGETVDLRNFFIFRAFPWFSLGIWIKKYECVLKRLYHWSSNSLPYAVCLTLGALLTGLELYWLGDTPIYFGTFLIIITLFAAAARERCAETDRTVDKTRTIPIYLRNLVSEFGRELSLGVYLLHGAAIDAVKIVQMYVFSTRETVWFSWIAPVLVIVLSITSAWTLNLLLSAMKRRHR